MKKLSLALIGVSALLAVAAAPSAAYADCQVGNCWGAVAYGPGGAWAYAVNYPAGYNFLTTGWGADDARGHIAWMADNCPNTRIVLGGFSQGALLSLELVARHDGLAGRVLAFGGRYCTLPAAAPRLSTLHFLHGREDAIFTLADVQQAFDHLAERRGDATLDVAHGVGHELHPALIECALQRLRTHIPRRTWEEALGALPAGTPPGDELH